MVTAMEAPTPVSDIGFTILSNPNDALIDIVFVHGLQGHPQNTWTHKSEAARSPSGQAPAPSKASKSDRLRTLGRLLQFGKHKRLEAQISEQVGIDQADSKGVERVQEKDVFWPRDLLKEDFPMARIMTFGYDTRIIQGYHGANQGNIFSYARDLLYELEALRRKGRDQHIIFIAHSLGGILVKEVLRRSETDPDETIKKIYMSTAGIFFFGTPHRGSKDWASFGDGVAGMASRLLGVDTNNQVIRALLPSGPELELCRESFATQWVARGSSLVVRTFQESKGVTGVRWGGLNQLIVPPDSSSLDHPNQRARTIDKDHIQMVKFKGREDRAYQMVKGDIEELVENIQVTKKRRDLPTNSTKEDQECIQHLRLTDPYLDKKRIEETKGGLLKESYRWILDNDEFRQLQEDKQRRLLWIKGDPGKGKTMLLCGIVNELQKSKADTDHLAYFFCQTTDLRMNNAVSVLRGLIYLLVEKQQSLLSHIRKKYDHARKALFEDTNAWVALTEIFTSILQDPSLNTTYLIIDALDECLTDLPKLFQFIEQKSSIYPRVKWIISSRNESNIERRLSLDKSGTRLSLELKENAEQVSRAVDIYIDYRIPELAEIEHDEDLQNSVRHEMKRKANGTFLWVSLVMKELKEVMAWDILQVLDEIPTELKEIYSRMIRQIKQLPRQDPELCRQVLSTIITTYRPLHLLELHALAGLPTPVKDLKQTIIKIVQMCGSFLTIRDDNVYIIHQSARDFLSEEASHDIFPSGARDIHKSIFRKSLQVMSQTLKRDMYSLNAFGYPIEKVKQPDPDPLAAIRYSCIYWVDHLCTWNPDSSADKSVDLQDRGAVDSFLRNQYLYWLEALSLCKSFPKGVVSIAKLEALLQRRVDKPELIKLVQDAHRFIMSHKWAIENSPLQTYMSALIFSPTHSLIRELFKKEEPDWITIKPDMEDKWSPCLQTLEGHSGNTNSVAFSHDSTRLASASYDETVKIWDASSGDCLQTLKGHSNWVNAVAFSHDSTRLASASYDRTVKIWDPSSGDCLQTLKGHSSNVNSVAFSYDSTRLVSASDDETVKIWDPSSGDCLQTLKGHSSNVNSVAFSHDSTRLVSALESQTVSLSISSDSIWISLDSENLLWLPSEYRPGCFAASEKIIGIGGRTRRVWICEVSRGNRVPIALASALPAPRLSHI